MAIALLPTAGCDRKAPKPDPPAKMVSAATLSPQTVRVYRDYIGRTEAFLSVDLQPQISAYVTGFFFKEGQAVDKGQLLFQMDAGSIKAAQDAAKARLARAEADLARARAQLNRAQDQVRRYAPLARIEAIPRQDYTDALTDAQVRAAELRQMKAGRAVAVADLKQADVNLGYTQIRAPIAGIIGARGLSAGGLATPRQAIPLATISQSDPIRVTFSVPDADYLRYLAPGGAGDGGANAGPVDRVARVDWQLKLADGSTYKAPGAFYAIGRAIDVETDTVLVELLFANHDGQLRPGQYAQVRANLALRRDVLLVPVSSVRISQGSKVVSVVGPGDVVAEKTIETEQRSGDAYVVTKGLAAGDVVIVGGEQKVRPGDKVKPSMEPQPDGRSNDPSQAKAPNGAGAE